MPYKSKRYSKRRRYPKKKRKYQMRRYANARFWGRAVQAPLGLKRKVVHRYVEQQVALNAGASGTVTAHTFSANGMYDPDISTAGHQPTAFDQMTVLYDHYVVIASKFRVSFTNQSGVPLVVGVALRDTTNVGTDLTNILENGGVRWKQLYGSTTDGKDATISMNCNVGKFLGRSKVLSDPQLKGSSSANPTEGVYFIPFCASADGSDPATTYCTIQIDYTAIWIEPKQIAES